MTRAVPLSESEPLVTVVIPVFNAGVHLRPAVDSVLAQSYRRLEVLVVDDGSRDGGVATLDDVGDPRLRVLRQANAGKSVALNRALGEMHGEYYALLDADDLSAPRRIERQLRCLQENPDVAAVFCGYDLILAGERCAPRWAGKDREACRRDIAGYRMPGHDPTAMFRWRAVADLRYQEDLRIGQGFDYVLRVGERHPMLVLGECLYSYRVEVGSNTRRDPARREAAVAEVLARARRRRGDTTEQAPARRRGDRDNNLAAHFMESVLDQRRAGARRAALRTAWRCVRLRPRDPHYSKALVYALMPLGLLPWLRRRVRRAGAAAATVTARGLAALVAVWLAVLTLLPFVPVACPRRPGHDTVAPPTWGAMGEDLGAHTVVFALLGVLLAWSVGGGVAVPVLATAGLAALELVQSQVPGRHALLVDWVCNSAAVALAYGLARRVRGPARAWLARWGRGVWQCLAAGLALAAGLIVADLHGGVALEGWQPSYRFAIGDEIGGQRPWQGDLKGVVIYPRALSAAEVGQLARESDRAPVRAEGTRLTPDLSPAATAALCRGVTATPELTVELIGVSAAGGQTGPARLVTFSAGTDRRNFTVGQSDDALVFRVRTPVTGPNGTVWAGYWPGVFPTDGPRHLVVTYARGAMRLFVDGHDRGGGSLAAARAAIHPLARGGVWVLTVLLFGSFGFALSRGWPGRRLLAGSVLAITGLLPVALALAATGVPPGGLPPAVLLAGGAVAALAGRWLGG